MILTSGRVIPNWILQMAFMQFGESTTMAEVIEDVNDIMEDGLNKTEHSKLFVDDALEVFKKFNEIRPDYEDMLDEFFEDHGLGHDEYDGNDNDDDDDNGDNDDDGGNAPDDSEDHTLDEVGRYAESSMLG